MGFLDKITKAFTGKDAPSDENSVWNLISSSEEIEELILASNKRTQIVFKHSPSCGVSFFAMRNLNTPEILENENIDLHLINVIRHRSISQAFAAKADVRHESPQIFILKDEKVIWHASHNLVNAKNVIDNLG
jgi:bacillithiol system protein YtxJ